MNNPQLECPEGHVESFDLLQEVTSIQRHLVLSYEHGKLTTGHFYSDEQLDSEDPYLVCNTCGLTFQLPPGTDVY